MKKNKPVTAVVTFPIYIRLSPKELKDKTRAEIKDRIMDLADDMMSDNILDMKGYITKCTIKKLVKKIPTIKKSSFSYSAKDAENFEDLRAIDAIDEVMDDTNMEAFNKGRRKMNWDTV